MNARPVYKSDCGRYLCRPVNRHGGGGTYEAWTIDGCIHWRDDNRIRTWADEKRMYPMVYSVGGYSATLTGQKPGSFTLNLLHCDVSKVVIPGLGNTIIESLDIVFRRKVPPQNVPHWLKDEVSQ
jgi:hypothetical protein